MLKNSHFSLLDKFRGVTIPKQRSSQLAEFLGIMLGDGNLTDKRKGRKTTNQITISGSSLEDVDYHHNYLQKVFKNLFSIQFKESHIRKNESRLRIYSKAIFYFLSLQGLQQGSKSTAEHIPLVIFSSNNKLKRSFLRGVFDTDGCLKFAAKDKSRLHKYPIIKIGLENKNYIRDIAILLNTLGFKFYIVYNEKARDQRSKKVYLKHVIYISGKLQLEKWMLEINSKNEKHLSKWKIWEKHGFCPPKTTLLQRKAILKGILDPLSFYD